MLMIQWIAQFWKNTISSALFYTITLKSFVNYALYPRPQCTNTYRLEGKTVVITGGNSGIGFETAKELYKQGARVILACRNENLATEAADQIRNECTRLKKCGEVVVLQMDLCSMNSVRKSALNLLATEKNIHFLINNAGAAAKTKIITEDGLESTFAIYLGHFLFTILLLPKLVICGPSRIINVTSFLSKIHRGKTFDVNYECNHFNTYEAYSQSKMAIVLFTERLAERLKGKGVSVYSVHPGLVYTPLTKAYAYSTSELIQKLTENVLLTPKEGAASILRLVYKLDDADSGAYFDEYGPSESQNDKKMAQSLWELSWNLVNRVVFRI